MLRRLLSIIIVPALLVSVASPSALALKARGTKVSAESLLRDLPVRDEQNSGYVRTKFRHWVDTNSNGCDTRDEVLLKESTITPTRGSGCSVSGQWDSRYDGVIVTDSSVLDIDHMIPLAEAWGSGAAEWNAATRQRFANDLSYGPSLIAVTASTNRSKSDRDPAEWLPPLVSYRCTYVAQWVAVKWRWQLSIDAAENSRIRSVFSSCTSASLLVIQPKRGSIGTDGGGGGGGTGGGGGGTGGGGSTPGNPGDTKNCGDFATWRDAQAWFDLYFPFYGDVGRLDADGDRIACESLPGAP